MKCNFAFGKRWLSLVLVCALLLGSLPFGGFATETEVPTEVAEAPTEVTEAPTEVTEAPTEVTEAPTETTEAPTEGTEAPAVLSDSAEPWDTDGDGVLEILAIGNSFSVDAMEYIYQIGQSLGIESIVLGDLYISGCTLATHASNAATDSASYTYYYNESGSWSKTADYKMSTALESRTWDYVTMQQGSPRSGLESTYNEDLLELIAYVQQRSDAKLGWHMTWAYQQDSTHSAFPTYNSDQMTMYRAIVSAVENKICTNDAFDFIIPCGTAVQNSRTSLLGDTTTRDGYHMSRDYGRYLTGLMWLRTVTGLDISGISYAPAGVDTQQKAIAMESVNNAVKTPFAVTQSKYTLPDLDQGYAQLELQLTKGAFWHPEVGTDLFFDKSNSNQFFATAKFTREQLPVGSVILLESGWQYRPDGWLTDDLQTGTREAVTTRNGTLVTEEWWGDYTIRSFNLSKVGNPSLEDVDLETAVAALQIYVPEAEVPEVPQPLAGKTISILGASISTFAGTSNGAAADTTNSTIRNNVKYYPNNTIPEVTLTDTWWMQVASDLDLRLLVNNAWSGSAILLERAGTLGAYVDRCVQLHDDTGDNAGEEPDIICIQMGFNDFSYGKDTLGDANIDYDALITPEGYGTPATTMEATAILLDKMTKRYPQAKIYMFNHFQRIGQSAADTTLMENLNASIAEVAQRYGVEVVDLYSTLTDPAHIGDGKLHPNKLGMDTITEAVKTAILSDHPGESFHSVTLHREKVTADYIDKKQVASGDPLDLTLTADDPLEVTVTMGGADITDTAYASGRVTIAAVTGDVVITARAVHVPKSYRWEFDGEDLVCTEGGNALTKNAGTTENGVFNKTRYALDTAVQLLHDQTWSVEWCSQGTFKNTSGSGARVFTSDDVNANYNARYLFKSNVDWLIAMGEKNTTGSHNYGVALADYGIDGSEAHTYRLENRIAPDGSNMVWLLVDGAEIGPLVHYYVGTKDQGTTSDWLSGKDFLFPYMGTDSHGFTNASIDYIQVREWDEPTRELALRYDDHYDITGKTVQILNAGAPTSYQVGYGVEENAVPDTAVVAIEGNNLVATGIGTARVMIDDIPYRVTVTASPISLLLLVGQSNMQGSEGDANQSIVCPEGMVYSTYGDRYTMTIDNATNFAPSALTGAGSSLNVNGTTANLSDWPVYLLNEEGAGKAGPDSGYAYEWVKATGEKVWVVNAAHGGTSINVWQPGTTEYEQCQALFTACQETLRKEISAGHFTLNHMVYFWCQGCSDRAQSAQWYVNKYLAMHEGFKTELSFDHDSNPETPNKTFEMGGITPVRVGSTAASYRDGVSQYDNPYSYHESFVDLRFSGPRAAQFWMGNNPELRDIHLVCTIGDDWVWMPDGTNGVTDYFQAYYPGGTVDYTPQVAQKASWYTPTTPKAVHDSIHYNQIGYNEVGREAVRNALILLGEKEAPAAETTVEFLTWDGVTPAEEIKAWTTGCSGSLVVPVVSPIWKAKEVTYSVTEGLTYSYYDLLASDAQTVGTLTAGTGDKVTVTKQDPGAYFAEHLSQLPESLCRGVNLWNVLEHDPYFYSSGTNWSKHSSGTVYSVTIPVKPGDKIFATSFGKAGENGHATANGMRCTFFGEYAVVKTLGPDETYGEFSQNGGYLTVPEGTVAMNIPMWSDADTNALYILSLPHDRTEGDCGICGKDSHVHSFGDWETLSLPSAEGPGTDVRKCSCGERESRSVEGSWQKYDLAAHMGAMPERFCAGTNLWNLLEHDPMYFASGKSWGKYTGGNVCSVTIPVEPGDKIFATAFGKAGENGNASSNGIRCTFFGSYDIARTMAPAETYAEFAANGGYLLAPEGAIAINVAMWSDGSENELYILNADHDYQAEVTAPTCTEAGFTTHTCSLCSHSYTTDPVAALGHAWETVTGAIRRCTLCAALDGGCRMEVPAEEVWIDGVKHTAREDEKGKYVLLESTEARTLVTYSYNDAEASDPHTRYPTGMQVWRLEFENGGYVSTYVPELENLLQYAGASIRVTGIKGIRMITGIDKALRSSLMDGTLGYTLVEYGTAVSWAKDLNGTAPLLGKGYTMSNFAYKKDVADPIFADTGNVIQYTNVLVGFTDDQLGTDLVLRPYIILKDAAGEQITIYGGCVQRSIAYIAKQNRDTFPEESKADAYIEDIISKVYG